MKSKKTKMPEALPEQLVYYTGQERIIDFKSTLDHYKDIKVMIDDLFDDFQKQKLDYVEICQSFIFFVIEVSYLNQLVRGSQGYKPENKRAGCENPGLGC